MPKTIDQLTQSDIKQIIADTYAVDVSKVTIKIHAPYNGGPLDSSPGDVTATVERPPLPIPKRG